MDIKKFPGINLTDTYLELTSTLEMLDGSYKTFRYPLKNGNIH